MVSDAALWMVRVSLWYRFDAGVENDGSQRTVTVYHQAVLSYCHLSVSNPYSFSDKECPIIIIIIIPG